MYTIKTPGLVVTKSGYPTTRISDFELPIHSDPYHEPKLWLSLETDAGGLFLQLSNVHEILGNGIWVEIESFHIIDNEQDYSKEFKTLSPEELATMVCDSLEKVGAKFPSGLRMTVPDPIG